MPGAEVRARHVVDPLHHPDAAVELLDGEVEVPLGLGVLHGGLDGAVEDGPTGRDARGDGPSLERKE